MEEEIMAMASDLVQRICYENWGQRILLYGASQILQLSQRIMYQRMNVLGQDLWVLDGANAFDPFLIARQAQKAKVPPEEFLRRVRISRSFTAHQMISLLRHLTKDGAGLGNRDYLLLGPLTSFYDENVPLYEARSLFQTFQRELDQLSGEKGIQLLVCQQPAVAHHRHFVGRLAEMADQVFCCQEKDQRLRVFRENRMGKQAKRIPSGTGNFSIPFTASPLRNFPPGN